MGERPDGRRCERGGGLRNGESEAGGLEELEESIAKRRFNSAFPARSLAFSASATSSRS